MSRTPKKKLNLPKRVRQFYEIYRDQPKLATVLRELSWSHNLAIMSRCKRDEERQFDLRMATRARGSFGELQPQLERALFEPTVLAPTKLSAALAELHPHAANLFKDSYLLEFLVAEYQTPRPDKKLLQAKLHEFYELAQAQAARPALEGPKPPPAQPPRTRKGKKS